MTKKIGKKGLMIILGGILTLLIVPGIAAGALVQGQTLQNGTLWITTYQTPTGTQYPQPFDSFHAKFQTLIGRLKTDPQSTSSHPGTKVSNSYR